MVLLTKIQNDPCSYEGLKNIKFEIVILETNTLKFIKTPSFMEKENILNLRPKHI